MLGMNLRRMRMRRGFTGARMVGQCSSHCDGGRVWAQTACTRPRGGEDKEGGAEALAEVLKVEQVKVTHGGNGQAEALRGPEAGCSGQRTGQVKRVLVRGDRGVFEEARAVWHDRSAR